MTTGNQRSLEVDFFRGAALLVILIDHIPGSALSHLMLHAYAYCDAAEVFVFLGGYATAAAYCSIAARGEPGAAARRFVKRAWEIYLAYLLTALLMLCAGLFMHIVGIHAAELDYTSFPQLLERPFHTTINIVTLRSQPYLSSVLPMYACFALAAPLTVPLARRQPIVALLGSLILWIFAQPLAQGLPSADSQGWGFNPFAWQLMFMFGMLCRLHPASHAFQVSKTGRNLTRVAWVLVLGCAAVKLLLETRPEAGHYKQNLAGFRVISFLALAWLAAQAVRAGWVGRLARAVPSVVAVGRHGLVCFVSGTVISITAGTALHLVSSTPGIHLASFGGLAADLCAMTTLLIVAGILQQRKTQRYGAGALPISPAANGLAEQPRS